MNPTTPSGHESWPSSSEILDLLRRVEIFEALGDADLRYLIAEGEPRRLERGEYLFRAGEPSDRMWVILAGAIEVVRSTPDSEAPIPVAYLSPGEAIGDMALFTGAVRHSAGRIPEFVEVLTFGEPVLRELTHRVPGYGLEVAKVFARRLEGFIKRMRGKQRRKELSGKLKYFDLSTVLQTLVAANQTGVLTLTDDDGKTWAEVLLLDGNVDRARCGLLEGAEAVFQLFHQDDRGEFFFRAQSEPDAESISSVRIDLTAMNLLMEAMRLVDELPSVQRRLPDPGTRYRARTKELQWEDEATLPIAEAVMAKLSEPRAIPELVDEVPCSAFTLYRVAAELYESRQIG